MEGMGKEKLGKTKRERGKGYKCTCNVFNKPLGSLNF